MKCCQTCAKILLGYATECYKDSLAGYGLSTWKFYLCDKCIKIEPPKLFIIDTTK